jgi:RND family efflux transporter MFP subunit
VFRTFARVTVIAGCIAFLALMAMLAERAVEDRRESAVESGMAPLLVRVRPVTIEPAYETRVEFIGRVQPARVTAAAFDLPGIVTKVHVDDGETVAAGDLLAELDTRRLAARRESALARIDQARADLRLARQTLDRTREAVEMQAIPDLELDIAERGVAAGEAAVRVAESTLAQLDVDLELSVLRAPFDAIVAARRVDEGDVASPGSVAVGLVERVAPEARVGVAGPASEAIELGDEVTVDVAGVAMRAVVKRLLPVRAGRSRTVDAILELDAVLGPAGPDGEPGVRQGDLVKWDIPRRIDADHARVPLDAMVGGTRGLWACFVAVPLEAPDGRATHRLERRDLELLHDDGTTAFVRGAIGEGDLVAVEGLHKLVPGLAVRLIEREDKR